MYKKLKKYQPFLLFGLCLWRTFPHGNRYPSHKNRGFLPNGVPTIGGVPSTD